MLAVMSVFVAINIRFFSSKLHLQNKNLSKTLCTCTWIDWLVINYCVMLRCGLVRLCVTFTASGWRRHGLAQKLQRLLRATGLHRRWRKNLLTTNTVESCPWGTDVLDFVGNPCPRINSLMTYIHVQIFV